MADNDRKNAMNGRGNAANQIFVPAKAVLTGDLSLEGDAWMEGRLDGDATSCRGSLLFGYQSDVRGTLRGQDVSIGGKMEGEVDARGQMSVFSGAHVTGKVCAAAMLVEEGADLHAQVNIGGARQKSLAGEVEKDGEKAEVER